MDTRRWRNLTITLPMMGLLASCSWFSNNEGPPQFAELVPSAMMQAALPPVTVPPPGPVDSSKAEPMATGGYGGHLASYFHEAEAVRGWTTIVHQQSSIGSLRRHIVPVQTPKGPMVRLIAGDFPNADEATRFCTWARQQHLYCAVMAVGPGDQGAKPVPAAAPRTPRRARRQG
jgi:hypothetical protein